MDVTVLAYYPEDSVWATARSGTGPVKVQGGEWEAVLDEGQNAWALLLRST